MRPDRIDLSRAGHGPAWAWPTLAGVGAVGIGALYPATAATIGPLALPAAVVAAGLLVAAMRRPGIGVAVAFLLTSLTPGLVGTRAWVPGVAWTALLFAVLVLSPAAADRGIIARLPPLALPVLAYGVTVVVAFALSPAPDLCLPILRSTVSGILLFLVAASTLRSWSDVSLALLGTSAAAGLVGGFACLQYVAGASTGIGFVTSTGALVERATAGFGHPNLLGGFLVVLIPLAVAGAIVDQRWRLVHLGALVLALGGVYASFSRGALLAVVLMPFLLLKGRWLLLLVPAAVLVSTVAIPSVMTERFALKGSDGGELAGRRDIWSTAGAIWVDQPVLGTGLGGFPDTYAAVRVSGKQFLPDSQFEPPPHAHNLELQLLAEQGLVGFTAFAVVAALAASSARRLRRSREQRNAVLGAALLASLVGILVHNLFDVTLLENAGMQFWGMLGLLSAIVALDRPEAAADGA